MFQVTFALSHMHLRGIAHRDIKPDNMLVDFNGFATIIDLGTAKFFGFSGTNERAIFEIGEEGQDQKVEKLG